MVHLKWCISSVAVHGEFTEIGHFLWVKKSQNGMRNKWDYLKKKHLCKL